jgi:hypothetical protein
MSEHNSSQHLRHGDACFSILIRSAYVTVTLRGLATFGLQTKGVRSFVRCCETKYLMMRLSAAARHVRVNGELLTRIFPLIVSMCEIVICDGPSVPQISVSRLAAHCVSVPRWFGAR